MSRARLALAAAACAIGALLRLPAIVEPLGIDQGIFAAAAWGMSRGGILYRDLWDQKPPGIHLLYRGAFAVLGLHDHSVFWLDYAAFLATIALLVAIGRRLVDASWGWGAAAVHAVLGLPMIRYRHGGVLERAVPETFIPLCALAAVVWVLGPPGGAGGAAGAADPPGRRRVEAMLAGAAIGCAALLKPTALIYWLMVLAVAPLISTRFPRRRSLAAWSAVGVATPIVLCMAWLWRVHALDDAWVAVIDYNRAYLGEGFSPLGFVNGFAHDVWRRTKTDPLWLLGMGGLMVGGLAWIAGRWAPRSRDGAEAAGATDEERAWLVGACWLGAALIAAAANGARFYNTYFIPSLVPLSLLAATLMFTRWRTRALRVVVVGVLLVAALRVAQSAVPRVMGAARFDLGQWRRDGDRAARLHYLEAFGGYNAGRGFSARANDELSRWIVAHSEPEDRVFIFGMAPGVYFSSRRLPAQRFLWIAPPASRLLPRSDFSLERVAADLRRTKPRFIIEEHHIQDRLLGWTVEDTFAAPPMREVLGAYEPLLEIEDFAIYGLRSTPAGP